MFCLLDLETKSDYMNGAKFELILQGQGNIRKPQANFQKQDE